MSKMLLQYEFRQWLAARRRSPDYDRDLDEFIVPDAIDIVEDFDEAEASAQPRSVFSNPF